MNAKTMKTPRITIGDNGHNARKAGNEGRIVRITRKPKRGLCYFVGDRLRVTWRDEFTKEDGGVYFVARSEPGDRAGYRDVYLCKSPLQEE